MSDKSHFPLIAGILRRRRFFRSPFFFLPTQHHPPKKTRQNFPWLLLREIFLLVFFFFFLSIAHFSLRTFVSSLLFEEKGATPLQLYCPPQFFLFSSPCHKSTGPGAGFFLCVSNGYFSSFLLFTFCVGSVLPAAQGRSVPGTSCSLGQFPRWVPLFGPLLFISGWWELPFFFC